MNKVILLVLLMPAMAFGQVMENFESGNLAGWIQSPEGRWNADSSNSVSGVFSMHHFYDNTSSGIDRVGLSVKGLHPEEGLTRWSFSLRYGCEPSSSNNWALFLMSGTDPPGLQNTSGLYGYVVGLNQTGNDDTLRLWKVKEGYYYPVVTSRVNFQSWPEPPDAARITIERTATGEWTLIVSDPSGQLIGSSSGNDPELFPSEWLILAYRYTSARDRLLWFDDLTVEGVFREDNIAPEVVKFEVYDMNSIMITFNEGLSGEVLSPSGFVLENGTNTAIAVQKVNNCTILVRFENEFADHQNKLIINKICDNANNCATNIAINFTTGTTAPGDILISEVMADPVPAVRLPAEEYLEIVNRTSTPVLLKDWYLTDGNQKYLFPDIYSLPGNHTIICSSRDTVVLNSFGTTIGLKTFPALTDGGKSIALYDHTGSLIHGIEYSPGWYGDVLKSSGGWSLEMIDTGYPFYGEGNWKASLSSDGGTPGKVNSVSGSNPDLFFTGIENVFPVDSLNITLFLSETVTGMHNKMKNISTDGPEIMTLLPSDPLHRKFDLAISESLKAGKIYTLTAGDEITDFAGNRMQVNTFRFGLPQEVQPGDLCFNELLFNPLPGDPDFIELYNLSDRIVDASRLVFVSVNDETNDTSGVFYLSIEQRCILPGDYYAVTTDRDAILQRFPFSDPFRIFEVSSLPSMPDSKGHLLLLNRELDKIDEVKYDEEMQYPLLQVKDGISLEKIRPRAPSGDRSQWYSASESSGWGTPGMVNTVFSEVPAEADQVHFSSGRITPDNDGVEDFLVIDLKFKGISNVVSVDIFDEAGGFVRRLTDNLFAGQETAIVWDGSGADEKIVQRGIYIFLISVFDDAGKRERWKKVCAVIR